jgi:hypothetical protein
MSENFPKSKLEVEAVVDLTVSSHDSQDVIVNEKRRRFARFAFGTPVIVTLASRPVFAVGCLSNMMSGNLSDPNRGQCAKGWSPGGWGQPGGQVHIYSTVGAWAAVGLDYGTYTPSTCSPGAATSRSDCYVGGSNLANVPSTLNKGSLPNTTSLRAVLTDPNLDQTTRHLVCAYLNALLGGLSGSTFKYVLTPAQVLALAGGGPLPSPYSNLKTFLSSTWN